MLELAITLIIISGVIALVACVPALGFGGRILPGYAFKARGDEAVKNERYTLRTVASVLYTAAVFVCAAGVLAYFKNVVALCVLGGIFVVVVVFWVLYFRTGKFKAALKAAKELTE